MEDISDFICPYIDKINIWEIAERFRKDHWPENTVPIDIEKIIERRLNLNIEPEHNLLSDYDMDAYLRNDLTGIVVDYERYMNDRYINRLRFSFAHELGHLCLHKEIYKNFGITDSNKWKTFILEIPEQEYKLFEYHANEFAGRLLVPVDQLTIELKKCLKNIMKNELFQLLKADSDVVLAAMSTALCKPFGVSDQVISIRVNRERLWPPKSYQMSREL